MSYTQLTREQRYQIDALKKADHSQTQMASIIGCHKSTIGRKLKRNGGQRGYRPKQANELSLSRKLSAHRPRIQPATWTLIESLVQQQWSPQQISGRLKLEQHESVSHESIYQHIYADKRAGGTLFLNLRCQKVRRKRYGQHDRRGQLPALRSIDERPKIVDSKRRLGDWEADTIIRRQSSASHRLPGRAQVEVDAPGPGQAQHGRRCTARTDGAVGVAHRPDHHQ
jgi:IS30 family transposase